MLATAPSGDALGGLDANGDAVVLGAPESPVPVEASALSRTRGSVSGWAPGSPQDAADTLAFSALRDVTPAVETFPLDRAEAAYRRMLSSDVRFRAVLTP